LNASAEGQATEDADGEAQSSQKVRGLGKGGKFQQDLSSIQISIVAAPCGINHLWQFHSGTDQEGHKRKKHKRRGKPGEP
jgi:hypothetical protein